MNKQKETFGKDLFALKVAKEMKENIIKIPKELRGKMKNSLMSMVVGSRILNKIKEQATKGKEKE